MSADSLPYSRIAGIDLNRGDRCILKQSGPAVST